MDKFKLSLTDDQGLVLNIWDIEVLNDYDDLPPEHWDTAEAYLTEYFDKKSLKKVNQSHELNLHGQIKRELALYFDLIG
jgi:hypothetical protein